MGEVNRLLAAAEKLGSEGANVVVNYAHDQAGAEKLVEQAHQVCPYSNATRGNIVVDVKLAEPA